MKFKENETRKQKEGNFQNRTKMHIENAVVLGH